eukprot:960099-Pelagomonas_calceolata.AAC.5
MALFICASTRHLLRCSPQPNGRPVVSARVDAWCSLKQKNFKPKSTGGELEGSTTWAALWRCGLFSCALSDADFDVCDSVCLPAMSRPPSNADHMDFGALTESSIVSARTSTIGCSESQSLQLTDQDELTMINYSLGLLLETRAEDMYRIKGLLSIHGSDYRYVFQVSGGNEDEKLLRQPQRPHALKIP